MIVNVKILLISSNLNSLPNFVKKTKKNSDVKSIQKLVKKYLMIEISFQISYSK